MFGITDGFEIVIGNPPYVRQEQIKEFKRVFQKQYECYSGTADLYVYFYERALQLLSDGGVLTYISSNKYFRAAYGEKLRGYLGQKTLIHQLTDFGDAPVFTAIAYPSVIITQKRQPISNQTSVLTWESGWKMEEFSKIFLEASFTMPQGDLSADGWRLENQTVFVLLDKMRKAGQSLGDYSRGKIYRGVITGLNDALIVDQITFNMLVANHKSSRELLQPFLRGRNIKRWRTNYDGQYLIKIESSENKQHPWSGKPAKEAEKVFAKTYPAIYEHLLQFRTELEKRDDQGKYFWELRSCAYWDEFSKTKIIYPDIYEHQSFAVDDSKFYCGNTCYFVPTDELWLCGLFNSTAVEWFYSQLSNRVRGGYMRAFTDYMKQIPIPKNKNPRIIEALVKKSVAAKRADPTADTTALEREIDQLIYQLYGLTGDEIAIVEGKR